MQDSYLTLIKFILPTYILDHFELKSVKEQEGSNTLEIQLEEPNVIPAEFGEGKFYSKGFYPEITIQDFPFEDTAYSLSLSADVG